MKYFCIEEDKKQNKLFIKLKIYYLRLIFLQIFNKNYE